MNERNVDGIFTLSEEVGNHFTKEITVETKEFIQMINIWKSLRFDVNHC